MKYAGKPLTQATVDAHVGGGPPITVVSEAGKISELELRDAAIASNYSPTEFQRLTRSEKAMAIAYHRLRSRINAMTRWWYRDGPGRKK